MELLHRRILTTLHAICPEAAKHCSCSWLWCLVRPGSNTCTGTRLTPARHCLSKLRKWETPKAKACKLCLRLCRLVEELTNVVKAPDSIHPVAPTQQSAPQHKLTDMLRQASQLLSDMRREGEGAADAIYAIMDVMDSDEYAAEHRLAIGPSLAQPGVLGGGGYLPLGALDVALGDAADGAPSPLQMAEGSVSPLPGDHHPVGVAEKVAWMDAKGHAPAREVAADVADDPAGSDAVGALWLRP